MPFWRRAPCPRKQKAKEADESMVGGFLATVIVCVWAPWTVVVVVYHCQSGGTACAPTGGKKRKTSPTASTPMATATTILVPGFMAKGEAERRIVLLLRTARHLGVLLTLNIAQEAVAAPLKPPRPSLDASE